MMLQDDFFRFETELFFFNINNNQRLNEKFPQERVQNFETIQTTQGKWMMTIAFSLFGYFESVHSMQKINV